jgi:predicted transcriptional regulator of viral defense system
MNLANTRRRQLYEQALDQYGYITTRDAAKIGASAADVINLVNRGGITRVGHGVYRFDDIPHTARDEFMEAILRVGPDAFLIGESVLALFDLGLVNPLQIQIGTPRRDRTKLPPTIKVTSYLAKANELTEYEGIPSITIGQAILDCRTTVMNERLVDAANEATRRGLIFGREKELIFEMLGAK